MYHHQSRTDERIEAVEYKDDPRNNGPKSCSKSESTSCKAISGTGRNSFLSQDSNFFQFDTKELNGSEQDENRRFSEECRISEPKIVKNTHDGALFFRDSDSSPENRNNPILKESVEQSEFIVNENYNPFERIHQDSKLSSEGKTEILEYKQAQSTLVSHDEEGTKNLRGSTKSVQSSGSLNNKKSTNEMSYGGLERDQQTITTAAYATESGQAQHKLDSDKNIKSNMQKSEHSSSGPLENKRKDGGLLRNLFSPIKWFFSSTHGTEQSVKKRVKVINSETEKSSSFENKMLKDESVDHVLALSRNFSKAYMMNYCSANPDGDTNTLENVLRYFGLSRRLEELEESLEEVRICKRTKEDHKQLLKQIDKEMQKLSLKHHPDKVKSRGGTEEDVAEAQKMQTILNATRTVLNVLSETFLEDIGTDHKYGFYKKLHMRSLGNENEIKNCIYEVLFKISMISEIKQECIIPEIRKFLTQSKSCIKEYLENNVSEFEKQRDLALFYLTCCIQGYEKLYLELEEVEKECKHEKLDNIVSVVFKMISECKRELTLLKELQKTAQQSRSLYRFFSPDEPMDPYFVLPFVSYVNVMLMCEVMIKKRRFSKRISFPHPVSKHEDLMNLYRLMSYHSGNHSRTAEIEAIIFEEDDDQTNENGDHINEGNFYKKCRETFNKILRRVNADLEDKFKVHNYVEFSRKNALRKELQQCMKMMAEFREEKEELLKDIEKLKKKTEEVEEKFEKYDKCLQESKDLSRNMEEALQNSIISMQRASLFLSNRL